MSYWDEQPSESEDREEGEEQPFEGFAPASTDPDPEDGEEAPEEAQDQDETRLAVSAPREFASTAYGRVESRSKPWMTVVSLITGDVQHAIAQLDRSKKDRKAQEDLARLRTSPYWNDSRIMRELERRADEQAMVSDKVQAMLEVVAVRLNQLELVLRQEEVQHAK